MEQHQSRENALKLHKPFHDDLIDSQGEIRIFLGGGRDGNKRDIHTTKQQLRSTQGGFHTSRPLFLVSPTKQSQRVSSGGKSDEETNPKRTSPHLPRLDSIGNKKPWIASATTGIFTPRSKHNMKSNVGLTKASQEFALGEFSM